MSYLVTVAKERNFRHFSKLVQEKSGDERILTHRQLKLINFMIGSENTLGDLRHITTAGSHLHRNLAISGDRQHFLLVVTSGTISIDAIPEKLDLVVTLTLQRNGLSEWMRLSSHFVWRNADFFVLLPP